MGDATMQLADGRALSWAEYGPADGAPVIACHGVPGSRGPHLALEAVDATRTRLLAVERPGFGGSDPAPGHSLLDAAADVSALADHLDLRRFAVLGLSAGAPTALACAHLEPDRVAVVGLACGVGPVFDQPRFDTLLPPDWQALLPLARQDRATTVELLRAVAEPAADACATDVGAQLDSMIAEAPPADRAEMEGVRDLLLTNLVATYGNGPDTFADEVAASMGPWGFAPSDIEVPVHLWHGDADEMAPLEVARFVASSLPDATFTVYPGEGHFLSTTHHADWLHALTGWSRD